MQSINCRTVQPGASRRTVSSSFPRLAGSLTTAGAKRPARLTTQITEGAPRSLSTAFTQLAVATTEGTQVSIRARLHKRCSSPVVTIFQVATESRSSLSCLNADWLAITPLAEAPNVRFPPIAVLGDLGQLRSMEDERGIVIIMVHGTWATNAPWTQPESLLALHLRDLLASNRPGQNVIFERCVWSGKNSFVARKRGAAELKRQIQANAQTNPSAAQFVIAHSHGGNVALFALGDLVFANPKIEITGIICLATPVIIVEETDQDPFDSTDWLYLVSAAVFAIGIVHFFTLPGLIVTFVAMKLLLQRKPYPLDEMTTAFRSPIFRAIEPEKVLFIRNHGDEASLALALFAFANWLSERLIKWPASLIENLFVRLFLRVLLSIIFAPVPLFQFALTNAYGPEAVRGFPKRKVFVETSPPGSWRVCMLQFGEGDDAQLRHSSVYDSLEAGWAIASFIIQRLKQTWEADHPAVL